MSFGHWFILLAFISFLSCNPYCETYDPTACESCYAPKSCIDGFCVCDINLYDEFAGFCEQKRQYNFVNYNNETQCISRQLVLDYLYPISGNQYRYWLRFMVDSVSLEEDELDGYKIPFPQGDSLALRANFTEKFFKGTLCKLYLYGMERNGILDCKVLWRDKFNYSNIVDSCFLTLYRDKP